MIKKRIVKIIYICLIITILYNIIIKIKNPNESTGIFGINIFCIMSGSMEPKINVNDIVVIKKVKQNKIKQNDIITFQVNEETITHRIINIEEQNGEKIYTTKGDANNVPDSEKIVYNNIKGKYIFKIPKIGKILLILKKYLIIILIFLCGIIIYFYSKKL